MCAFLLSLLNRSEGRHKTKFVVSDEHTNITACTLPEWLPGQIVYLMVVEFSRRLRVELKILVDSLESNASGRSCVGHVRTKSSDTGRFSLASALSEDMADAGAVDQVEAFSGEFEQ